MDAREPLRQQLKDTWKRVPGWIGGASVQQVRDYKKVHAAMVKLIDKSNASLGDLQAAVNQTRTIYQ